MRLLKINGQIAEIDEQTAIGITLQSYNIKEPGQKHVNISNSFTIPNTAKNKAIFGNIDDPQSESLNVYNIATCDYWVHNEQLIDNAKIRVQSIQDRIELFIYEKLDFWDNIKKETWKAFIFYLFDWLTIERGLPVEPAPDTGTASSFLDTYISNTEGIYLPVYFSNMLQYKSVGQNLKAYNIVSVAGIPPTDSQVTFSVQSDVAPVAGIILQTPTDSSSDIAVKVADELNILFGAQNYNSYVIGDRVYIESITGLFDDSFNFAISGNYITTQPVSILEQSGINATEYFIEGLSSSFNPVISLKQKTANEDVQGGHFCIYLKTILEFIEYRFNVNLLSAGGQLPGNIFDDPVFLNTLIPLREFDINLTDGNNYFIYRNSNYLPYKEQKNIPSKTVNDFINSFMQTFNLIKDEVYLGGEKVIKFARFDEIKNLTPKEFSGKVTGTPKFKPLFQGIAQENYIKFKKIYPEGAEDLNSKKLTCNNLNIDVSTDLFSIDSYIPSVITGNESYLNLSDKDSFETFTFLINTGEKNNNSGIKYTDYTKALNLTFVKQLNIVAIYNLDSEYNFYDEIISNPKYYELNKWLTISDIRNFEFFNQYYIRELNGSFFVNKIKGFNPLSKKPTTLELIKVSNKTPLTPPDLDYWMDGIEDPFTDGLETYFY